MNTENSKTSKPHRFKLDLTDKLNLKNPNKNLALANLSIYYASITDIKKHETLTKNPPVQIYPNKIKHRIVFKIKTGYKLGLLTLETLKLLGSKKKDDDKDKDISLIKCLVKMICHMIVTDNKTKNKT